MTVHEPDTLAAAGLLAGEGGSLLLAGPAQRLFTAWTSHLAGALEAFYTEQYATPAFIAGDVLEAARYPEHFPQNLVRGHGPAGRPVLCCAPATCLHLYPTLRGRVLGEDGASALLTGPCARYEDGCWRPPFRLDGFHMCELVVVGTQAQTRVAREAVQTHLEAMFAAFGLAGAFVPAEDAFFMGSGRGARLVQRLKALKLEYQAPAADGAAVASINDHEQYFGRAFDIRTADGAPAYSFCAAFGLERLTALGLLAWGADPGGWPEALQA